MDKTEKIIVVLGLMFIIGSGAYIQVPKVIILYFCGVVLGVLGAVMFVSSRKP